MVAVRDKRQRRYGGLKQLGALLELEHGSRLGQVAGNIAHGDRPLQGRREAAAGDPADFIALAVENQCALAYGLAAADVEPDQLLRRAILQLGENPHRTRETALGAAALLDGEGNEIGRITSGGFSPSLQRPIAMGYIAGNLAEPGTALKLEQRSKLFEATVAPLPFVPHRYHRKGAA